MATQTLSLTLFRLNHYVGLSRIDRCPYRKWVLPCNESESEIPKWDMHWLRAKEFGGSLNSQTVPKTLVHKNDTAWFVFFLQYSLAWLASPSKSFMCCNMMLHDLLLCIPCLEYCAVRDWDDDTVLCVGWFQNEVTPLFSLRQSD